MSRASRASRASIASIASIASRVNRARRTWRIPSVSHQADYPSFHRGHHAQPPAMSSLNPSLCVCVCVCVCVCGQASRSWVNRWVCGLVSGRLVLLTDVLLRLPEVDSPATKSENLCYKRKHRASYKCYRGKHRVML
jgi:hypothetical protein